MDRAEESDDELSRRFARLVIEEILHEPGNTLKGVFEQRLKELLSEQRRARAELSKFSIAMTAQEADLQNRVAQIGQLVLSELPSIRSAIDRLGRDGTTGTQLVAIAGQGSELRTLIQQIDKLIRNEFHAIRGVIADHVDNRISQLENGPVDEIRNRLKSLQRIGAAASSSSTSLGAGNTGDNLTAAAEMPAGRVAESGAPGTFAISDSHRNDLAEEPGNLGRQPEQVPESDPKPSGNTTLHWAQRTITRLSAAFCVGIAFGAVVTFLVTRVPPTTSPKANPGEAQPTPGASEAPARASSEAAGLSASPIASAASAPNGTASRPDAVRARDGSDIKGRAVGGEHDPPRASNPPKAPAKPPKHSGTSDR